MKPLKYEPRDMRAYAVMIIFIGIMIFVRVAFNY